MLALLNPQAEDLDRKLPNELAIVVEEEKKHRNQNQDFDKCGISHEGLRATHGDVLVGNGKASI